MTEQASLDATDLAALICSKVCHDIINPVGAIINGLEVLSDDDGGDMKDVAMELIWKSAEAASVQLKFARFAFGAAGSAGASMDLGDIKEVAVGYLTTDRVKMEWTSPMGQLAKDDAKLLLNLIMVAPSTIVRGGTISIVVGEDLDAPDFKITCKGRAAKIPDQLELLYNGEVDLAGLDARKIQPYFLGLMARSVGAAVDFRQIDDGTVELSAVIAR